VSILSITQKNNEVIDIVAFDNVIELDQPSNIVELNVPNDIIEIISRGPQGAKGDKGDKGDRGDAGQNYVVKPALGNIGGERFVIGNLDGTVSYADATNLSHLGRVVGISLNAASDGDDVEVLIFGYIEFNGWNFDISAPVYLSTDGLITQTQPTTGFSQIVGFAESPTRLFINLREPIILGD